MVKVPSLGCTVCRVDEEGPCTDARITGEPEAVSWVGALGDCSSPYGNNKSE